jgi:hypothetical protein
MKHLKILGLMALTAMAVMAFGAASASATTLEIGGVAQNKSVTIESTLASGTSAILKDEFGTTTDTCTSSTVKGSTVSPFTGTTVGGTVSSLTFGNCTHTTTVLANGSLSVAWTSGTNGSVKSSGAEVTVNSTFFGASAVCKTGSGTTIGTLTGVKSGKATMDINATIACGILGNSSWTGTYSVTSPEGLGVVS